MLNGYAVKTTFHGATNYRGSRVSAERMDAKPSTGKRERVTIEWDHALNPSENHKAAARALLDRNGWTSEHTLVGTAGWERGSIFLVCNASYAAANKEEAEAWGDEAA